MKLVKQQTFLPRRFFNKIESRSEQRPCILLYPRIFHRFKCQHKFEFVHTCRLTTFLTVHSEDIDLELANERPNIFTILVWKSELETRNGIFAALFFILSLGWRCWTFHLINVQVSYFERLHISVHDRQNHTCIHHRWIEFLAVKWLHVNLVAPTTTTTVAFTSSSLCWCKIDIKRVHQWAG